jgi:hypothetical protein
VRVSGEIIGNAKRRNTICVTASVTRVTIAITNFANEELTLLSTEPFSVTRVTLVACVTTRVTHRWLIDALMVPAGDVPKFLPFGLVFDEQALFDQLVDPAHHGVHGGVVIGRKHLGLERANARRMVAAVVAEIPQADEQAAGVARAVHDLLGRPVFGFD